MVLLSTYAELQEKYRDRERLQAALRPAGEANDLAHAAVERGDREAATRHFAEKDALLLQWLLLDGVSIQITEEGLLIHYRLDIGLHFPETKFLSCLRDSQELTEKQKNTIRKKYRKACRRAGRPTE